MMQVKLAWAALKNMLRAALRDPLWALIFLPFRAWKPVLTGLTILLAVLLVVVFGGRALAQQFGFGPGSLPFYFVTRWPGLSDQSWPSVSYPSIWNSSSRGAATSDLNDRSRHDGRRQGAIRAGRLAAGRGPGAGI